VATETIKDIQVLQTIVAGNPVHAAAPMEIMPKT
jgi:hypothetical protein